MNWQGARHVSVYSWTARQGWTLPSNAALVLVFSNVHAFTAAAAIVSMTGHDLEPSRLLHCMVPCLMQLHSTVFTLCSVVVCCPFVLCRLAQQCPLDTCRLAADPEDLLSACMQVYRCICAPICIDHPKALVYGKDR